MKVHHVGYLVKSIDDAKKTFQELGYIVEQDLVKDSIRKIDIIFLRKDGLCVELVSAYEKDSVVGKLHKKIGNSPYHICYISDKPLNIAITEMEMQGFMTIAAPEVAVALGNKKVVFMYHPTIGMIEIVEGV